MNRSTSRQLWRGFRSRLGRRLLGLLFAGTILSGFASAEAADVNLYWDTNGTAAGSGAPTGTWGTSNFWNTDPLGGAAGAFSTATTASNDVFFSAGTTGTTGTVTVSGTVLADSITFQNNVAITLSGMARTRTPARPPSTTAARWSFPTTRN